MQQPSEQATTEQRARAVQYWTDVVRPQMAAKEQAKAPEDPHAALARLKAEGWANVQISPALTKILGIKKDHAA